MNEINGITVNHMRHTDKSYSMTIERAMTEEHRPMTDMCAKTHSTNVTFYGLTSDQMLALATGIFAEAYKAKASEECEA